MSATTEQKVDFLLKKVGFTLSKTGSVTGTGSISGGTTKEPFAESLPSPLVVPDTSIWNQSLSIPTTPPGSDTSIVKVYSTSSAHRMTADSSVSGSRAFIAYSTYNNTSSARLTDWIDTQFGTAYVLKVYKGDPNSGGTLLPAGGSGSNDGWFFDYSSGVLNFNGSGLPSGVTDTNIYIVGYRYIGSKGVSSPAQINPTNLFVAGISTFAGLVDINAGGQANTFKVEDLTSGRVVLAGTGGEIEDSGNLTFNGNTLGVTGSQTISSNFSVTGISTLASINVSGIAGIGSLTVAGVSTFTGNIDANGNLDVDGQTDLDILNVAELATFTGNIDANGSLDVDGHTELDNLGVSGVSTFVGVGTFNSDLSIAGEVKGFTNLSAPHSDTITTYTVTVATKDSSHRYQGQGSSLGYLIDGVFSPFLTLTPGRTYRFDQSDNSNSSHPINFYLEADKTTTYSTGVTVNGTAGNSGAYTQIAVGDETPIVLHYQCTAHGYMGNAVQVNSNVVNSNYAATLRGGLSVTGGETTLSSATVSDLTSGRVVLAGGSGALQDNSNLTFNGSQLGITGTVNASSTITGTEFHTGASGSAIRVTSNTISGPATFTLDPAAVGDNTGKVIIAGDLQVDGTTTTVNSTTVNIVDKNIQVATGSANDAAANGGGITIASGDGNKTFQFEATGDNLASSEHLNLASGKDYKINNTSVLNATTLGSGVVNSSLTNVGTLTSLDVSGHAGIGSLTVAGVTTSSGGVRVNADGSTSANYISVGASDDLKLYHQGGNSIIHNSTGYLELNANAAAWIKTTQFNIIDNDATHYHIRTFKDDRVELYFNNVRKLQTSDTGVTVTGKTESDSLDVSGHAGIGSFSVAGISTFSGNINLPDSVSAVFGTDDDGSIKHTGTNLQIFETTGNIQITNYANDKDVAISSDDGSGGTTNYFLADGSSGAVKLFHYGNPKLETYSGGVSISGSLLATGGITANTNITIENIFPQLFLVDTNNNSDFALQNLNGTFVVNDTTNSANRLVIDSVGKIGISTLTPTSILHVVGDSLITGVTTSTGGFVGNLTGNVTGNADTATLATRATDLAINGTNQLLYQASNNDSAILPTGSAGQILQSSGSGAAPQWVTSAPAGAIEGVTIRDESSIVGSANSISTINFIGQAVSADAAVAAGIATVTINAIPGVLVKEDEANVGTAITAFDFSGSLVDVDAISNTGIATVQIDALSVKDQGSTVGTAGSITTFNFLGDGVTATASGETATVTVSAIPGVLVKEDEANVGTAITAFDFSGSLVDVDAASNSGIATVQIDGLTVKDEGSTVGTAGSITTINFVGTGIAAAVSGGTATVTASGGATTDDVVALAIALG